MPRRRRREGFDYFIDRYEDAYDDYYDDGYYYENDTYIPGNRFQKLNRYTGQVQGQKQFINTSTIYTGAGYPSAQQQGTLEFSAIPGQGGLNPNERPLGDQTMLMSTNSLPASPNPYVQQILQTQQTQQIQLDQQNVEMNNRFNEISAKVDNIARTLENSQTLTLNNTQSLKSPAAPAKPVAPTAQVRPPMAAQKTGAIPTPVTRAIPNPTAVVQKAPKKKKKISKGTIIGGIFGILIALGLIAVGVLMLLGIITF